MIVLNISTSKKELLDHLAKAVNEPDSEVYIKLDSLPVFLRTPISFTVFNYQISNYPKKIIWATKDPDILGFLQKCNVATLDLSGYQSISLINISKNKNIKSLDIPKPTPLPAKIIQEIQQDYQQKQVFDPIYNYPDYLQTKAEEISNKPILENNLANSSETNLIPANRDFQDVYYPTKNDLISGFKHSFVNKPTVAYNLSPERSLPLDNRISSDKLAFDELEIDKFSTDVLEPEGKLEIKKSEEFKRPSNRISLTAKDLLKEKRYSRSSLLDKIEENKQDQKSQDNHTNMLPEPETKTDFEEIYKQPLEIYYKKPSKGENLKTTNNNLDEWLKRIETTRRSLEKIRQQNSNRSNRSLQAADIAKAASGAKMGWQSLSFLSVFLTFIIVGFVSLFPTRVYTINVNPNSINQSTQITLPLNRFSSQEINLETTETQNLDTKAKKEVDRSIGQVEIVNSSGGAIAFDRSGIILTAQNGKTYRQVASPEDPATYRLPANGGSVTITIQATGDGDSFNLDAGEVLSLKNLRRESLGNKIQATVINQISNIVETEDKIVTERNYNSLKAISQDTFQEKIQESISAIDQNLYLTNPAWYRDFSSDYVFDKEVGQTSKELNLQAKAKTEIFYFPKIDLEKILRTQFNNIRTLQEVKLNSFEGSFNDINQQITLNLDFIYIEKTALNKDMISQTLSQKDLESAKKDIIETYPNIESINELKNGIDMPGVPSLMEIEIRENY
jgi:hypothetical protein